MTYSINMNTVGWKATMALLNLDKTFIGDSENYMGLCYFWNYEYRHYLRDASVSQNKRVHKKWLDSGLDLVGVSQDHLDIINQVLKIKGQTMTKNMKLSDWENYASDLGGEIITEMDAVTWADRYWLVLPEIDGQQNEECELSTDDYGDTHYVYEGLDTYRERILKKLASKHPDCLHIHSDIKNLAPLSALKALLDAGYSDTSYGNDETPSYYKEMADQNGEVFDRYIFLYDDVVKMFGKRVSDVIKFNVTAGYGEPDGHVGIFDTIEEAIKGGES